MIYAVKFWSQAPVNEPFREEGVPLDWVWRQQSIDQKSVAQFQQMGWTCFTPTEYKAYLDERQSKFNLWFNNRAVMANKTRLKVLDLVDDSFKRFHPSKIDFTIHLRPDVVLNKETKMLKNGRPEKAEYYYQGEKICEIKFEFDVSPLNFVTARRELLGYVQGDGQIAQYFLIRNKTFDMSNFADKSEVVEERVSARQYIMKEIKAVLNDVLGYYYIIAAPPESRKTPQELWKIAGDFWTKYSGDIDAWYNTATEEFKDKILADTEFAFMDLIAPTVITQEAENKSVRQYIIDRITY